MIQYNLAGEKLQIFESIALAASFHKIPRTLIWNSISGRSKSAAGYIWKAYQYTGENPDQIETYVSTCNAQTFSHFVPFFFL